MPRAPPRPPGAARARSPPLAPPPTRPEPDHRRARRSRRLPSSSTSSSARASRRSPARPGPLRAPSMGSHPCARPRARRPPRGDTPPFPRPRRHGRPCVPRPSLARQTVPRSRVRRVRPGRRTRGTRVHPRPLPRGHTRHHRRGECRGERRAGTPRVRRALRARGFGLRSETLAGEARPLPGALDDDRGDVGVERHGGDATRFTGDDEDWFGWLNGYSSDFSEGPSRKGRRRRHVRVEVEIGDGFVSSGWRGRRRRRRRRRRGGSLRFVRGGLESVSSLVAPRLESVRGGGGVGVGRRPRGAARRPPRDASLRSSFLVRRRLCAGDVPRRARRFGVIGFGGAVRGGCGDVGARASCAKPSSNTRRPRTPSAVYRSPSRSSRSRCGADGTGMRGGFAQCARVSRSFGCRPRGISARRSTAAREPEVAPRTRTGGIGRWYVARHARGRARGDDARRC